MTPPRCLQLSLPSDRARGGSGFCFWGHPDTRTEGSPAHRACGGDAHRPVQTRDRQLPRLGAGCSDRRLPARARAALGTAVSHPRWLCPGHPAPALVTSLPSACHTSVFKSPRLPQRRGVKGGRPAQRPRCQGRPDLQQAGAGGSARPAPGPTDRSLPAPTWSALRSARGPSSVHRSRRPLPQTRPTLPTRS